MSGFQALAFNWDKEHSSSYDVYIVGFSSSAGWQTSSAGSNMNIISDSIPRGAEQYTHGISQENQQQQFTIQLSSDTPKSRAEVDRIIGWLRQPTPKHFTPLQDDTMFYRYTGFFTNPQLISSGRRPFGLQFTFVSTSPFAHTFPLVKEYNIYRPMTVVFNNESGDSEYLRPTLFFTPTNTTMSFSLINESDNNREFRFDFQAPWPNGAEVITVNNRLQVIESSMGSDFTIRRHNEFNNKWFRLLRGQNRLNVIGNGLLKLEYKFARLIGA